LKKFSHSSQNDNGGDEGNSDREIERMSEKFNDREKSAAADVNEEIALIDNKLIEFIVLFLCLFIVGVDQQHCVRVTHCYLWNFHL
jgi:hypothetical protein